MTADELSAIRDRIDALDAQIVRLLAVRQQEVEAAGTLKRGQDRDAVRAPDRVEGMVAKVRALADAYRASPAVVERTYRAMIAAFIEHELTVHRGSGAP